MTEIQKKSTYTDMFLGLLCGLTFMPGVFGILLLFIVLVYFSGFQRLVEWDPTAVNYFVFYLTYSVVVFLFIGALFIFVNYWSVKRRDSLQSRIVFDEEQVGYHTPNTDLKVKWGQIKQCRASKNRLFLILDRFVILHFSRKKLPKNEWEEILELVGRKTKIRGFGLIFLLSGVLALFCVYGWLRMLAYM